jgi:guanylate cyclase
MAILAGVWVGTYAALGLWVSAAIPFAYQLVSAASIYTFARKRRYRLFRHSQLWMSLVFPFVLQVSLGGFENSSAVCLWGFTAPLGALLLKTTGQNFPASSALFCSARKQPAASRTADYPSGT